MVFWDRAYVEKEIYRATKEIKYRSDGSIITLNPYEDR